MLDRILSPVQEHCLLRKQLCGEFPARKMATISALMRHGMLEVVDRHYAVSEKGKAYCDAFWREIRI